MELQEPERGQLHEYLSEYGALIGGKRTSETFWEVIEGIIGSESLKAAKIGRFSPRLATNKSAEQNVRRRVNGKSKDRAGRMRII